MLLTDQEKVHLENKFRELVKDPDFQTVIHNITLDYAKKMLDTEDENARTQLYYECRALRRMVGEFKSFSMPDGSVRMNYART